MDFANELPRTPAVTGGGLTPKAGTDSRGPLTADQLLFGVIAVVVLSLLTLGLHLGDGPPLGDHEGINALAARRCLQVGDCLIPSDGETPRIRKMPLGIWLISAAAYVTGDKTGDFPVGDISARLPSAVAGACTALLLCWFGTRLFDSRIGLIAGLIWASCAAAVFYARNAQVDMVLTFFTTLAFALFWRGTNCDPPDRRFLAGFYVAFALAMLSKAPLPLAIVGLPLAVYWLLGVPILGDGNHGGPYSSNFVSRWAQGFGTQFRRIGRLWLVPGVVLFVLLAGAWPAYVYFKIDNALDLWRLEYFARYSGGLGKKAQPFWYYGPIAFGLTAPFFLSLPEAIVSPFLTRYRSHSRGLMYVWIWAVVGTVFLSTSAFKRPHYLLSVVPALCLLLAPVVDRLFFGAIAAGRRLVTFSAILLTAGLAAFAVGGGFWVNKTYPSLLCDFIPAIIATTLVWCLATWVFVAGRRLSSFALLNLGVPILVWTLWPASAHALNLNAEAVTLARKLHEHGVKDTDAIYWADKRPNSTIEFYTGLPVRRLVDEIELAAIREDRSTISDNLAMEIVDRAKRRIEEVNPVYFIQTRDRYERWVRAGAVPADVLFQLEGFNADLGDELVVLIGRKSSSRQGTDTPE